MNLAELLNGVKVIQVVGNAELKEIESISIDSRTARKNSLFFAIKGEKSDGHKFIQDVINNGAAGVVLQNPDAVPDQIFTHSSCIKILVENSRKSLADFSNIFFDDPSKKLTLVGVTGTKGKTTTAFFIKNIFQTAGIKSGLIGTIANYIGDREVKTLLTTPQSHEINDLLSQMLKDNCGACVMEVSSHALRLNRVDDLDFNVGIFTNITSDHMDYHKTFEHYLESKKILFDMIPETGNVVINSDDPNSEEISKDTKAKVHLYGSEKDAECRAKSVEYSLEGTTFEIEYKNNNYKLETKLVGHFNAYNRATTLY